MSFSASASIHGDGMSSLKKSAAENIYRMEGSSAWIIAGDADIWLLKNDIGVSISVWPKSDDDPIDTIFLTWDKIKGERK